MSVFPENGVDGSQNSIDDGEILNTKSVDEVLLMEM
jgi:hypothetical protein